LVYSGRTAADSCNENCTPRLARVSKSSTLRNSTKPAVTRWAHSKSNQSTSPTCGSPPRTGSRDAQVCGRLGPSRTRSPSSYSPTWSPMNRSPREFSVNVSSNSG
jgi:hypothetical protein